MVRVDVILAASTKSDVEPGALEGGWLRGKWQIMVSIRSSMKGQRICTHSASVCDALLDCRGGHDRESGGKEDRDGSE